MRKYLLCCLYACIIGFFSICNAEFIRTNDTQKELKYHPKTKDALIILVQDENVNLGDIDTSSITDMSFLFVGNPSQTSSHISKSLKSEIMNFEHTTKDRRDFSGIESWDTSSVENMEFMFYNATSFNQNINSWNVSNVVNMYGMFKKAKSFNQPLDKWDTSKIALLGDMFTDATSFNQNLDSWNVCDFSMFKGSQLESNPPKWYRLKETYNESVFITNLIKKVESKKPIDDEDKYVLAFITNCNIAFKPGIYRVLEELAHANMIDMAILAPYKEKFTLLQEEQLSVLYGLFNKEYFDCDITDTGVERYMTCRDKYGNNINDNAYQKYIELAKKFTIEHFAPVEGCTIRSDDHIRGMDFCADDGHEFVGYYKLIKPLKLKGFITFINNADYGEDCGDFENRANAFFTIKKDAIEYYSSLDVDFTLNIDPAFNDSVAIYATLPQWFKEGLVGSVSFEAEFEIINTRKQTEDIMADVGIVYVGVSDCYGSATYITPKNIKLGKIIHTDIKDKKWYQEDGYYYGRLVLDSKDSYVNLRESPNGKILAKMQMKDKDKIILFNLTRMLDEEGKTTSQQRMVGIKPNSSGEVESSSESDENSSAESNNFWYKVLYFPPNVIDAKKAVIGYVHSSQVEHSEVY